MAGRPGTGRREAAGSAVEDAPTAAGADAPEPPAAGRGSARRMPVLKTPVPEEALPRHVVSHASGGRDLWSSPRRELPEDPVEAATAALREVLDPELPISLVDLGLIYGVTVEEGVARVALTFTATACPCMEFIKEDIRDRLCGEHWVERVEIDEVWDPPWTRERITPEGRRRLRALGVGS